jgi:MoxR-like ATPase
VDQATVLAMQAALEDVVVSDAVIDYCVALVHATRHGGQVHAGASPRGVEALVKLGRARAVLDRRSYVTPDDVKAVAVPALAHRIVLRPELWVRGIDAESVVAEMLTTVPTPQTLPLAQPQAPGPGRTE